MQRHSTFCSSTEYSFLDTSPLPPGEAFAKPGLRDLDQVPTDRDRRRNCLSTCFACLPGPVVFSQPVAEKKTEPPRLRKAREADAVGTQSIAID